MNNWKNLDSQEMRIQELIDRVLKTKQANKLNIEENHLDDDTLTIFIEGKSSEKESKSIIKHLVECSFCRHITAELIKLDFAFAETDIKVTTDENQPSKISDVLSGVISKIFGSNKEAVFAHQEDDDNQISDNSPNKTEDLEENP